MPKTKSYGIFDALILKIKYVLRVLCTARVDHLSQHLAIKPIEFSNPDSEQKAFAPRAHLKDIRWMLTPQF